MKYNSPKLGVNVDHVAAIREARGTIYPSPIAAAQSAVAGGADQITVHLREDRRHIQYEDVANLKKVITVPINLEMAVTDEMVRSATALLPTRVTFVPEKRRELTTEGGLDVTKGRRQIKRAISRLTSHGIKVSLFINPDRDQIDAALELEADAVELHTGCFADATSDRQRSKERERLLVAARHASGRNLFVAAGHGLHIDNVTPVAAIREIWEFNIGHGIVARAMFVGMEAAVREIKQRIEGR